MCLNYILENKLNKACFAHDTAYTASNDLAKGILLDKIMKDKACEIPLNPLYDGD